MAYRRALSLQIAHEYWGNETIPLQIRPNDPQHIAKLGLLSRSSPACIDIISDDEVFDTPQTITVDVIASNPNMTALTDGPDWAQLPVIDLTEVASNSEIALADVPMRTDATRNPGDPLLRINLNIPREGTLLITLRLSAVSALWAYHVTGNRVQDPLQVIDSNNISSFEDLGESPLPDGSIARVFRSTTSIPLRHRPDTSFALEAQQDPPFDPITLIPVLPAAGVNLRPAPDAATALQSDIFVSLW